jgi:phospholipid/cholesterol/gamma-HCH transport system substrate-binding protein
MERWGETILGAIVVAVAAVFFGFAAAQAGQSGGERQGGYELVARFQRADGIAPGSDVRVSGVKVGVVREIDIDASTYFARVKVWIDRGIQVCAAPGPDAAPDACTRWRTIPVEILDDSTARIASDGLLGGAYVAIEPTGFEPLPPGGEIPNTQGSVDLLTLLSSAMQGMGGGNADEEAQEALPE